MYSSLSKRININETYRWGGGVTEHDNRGGSGIGPEQMSSLTQCSLFNIFKVEIRGFTVRLNSLRQRERGECCSLVRGRERGLIPDGKGDGGEKDGGVN